MAERNPLYEFGRPLELGKLDPSSTRARVLGNFYLTFWYAQGNDQTDRMLTMSLFNRYHTTWDAEARQELGQLGPLTATDAAELRLPPKHVDPQANVRKQFEGRWNQLHAFATNPALQETSYDGKMGSYVRNLGSLLVKRDIAYNTTKERHFSTCGDPHESMYRTFILDNRDAGSPELNDVFSEIRNQHQIAYAPLGLEKLEEAWAQTHPGETFYDPAVVSLAPDMISAAA
jgi:hypothetical protein